MSIKTNYCIKFQRYFKRREFKKVKMNNPVKKLAEFSLALSFEKIPQDIVKRIKWGLLDSIGVILGASVTDEGKYMGEYVKELGGLPQATAVGFGFKTSCENAALLNGTLTEMLEMQDGFTPGANHPSSTVIPSVLSQAERQDSDGKSLITALVVGYEAANRFCACIHPSHISRGYLPTGTAGTLGACVGIANMRKVEPEILINALGIAGFILPISCSDNLFSGYNIKPIHGGQAARAAIEAVCLAGKGFIGCPIEGDPPRYHSFLTMTCDKPNVIKLSEDLGKKYTIRDVYSKPFSSCRQTHGSAEVTQRLMIDNQINPKQIDKVVIRTDYLAAKSTGNNYTNISSSFVACQFSTPYVTAAVLLDGEMTPAQLSKDRISDPAVHELANKIEVIGDRDIDALYPEKRPTIVEIYMKGGEAYKGRVDFPKGDQRNPMTEQDLIEKFRHLTSQNLGEEQRKKVISFILNLENEDHISKLFSYISSQQGS